MNEMTLDNPSCILKFWRIFVEEYSLDLHRELGNVLAIQRLKAFLHESAGDCIFSFWLAIERYRRQTPPECLRFVIRDIQDKFIRQGAWLELPECFKSSFKSCLDQVSNKSTCKIDVINSDLLTSCQDLAFASLTSYWVPKYLAHKRLRKSRVKQKWRLSLPSKPSGKPSMFGEVVRIQLSGIEEERKSKILFQFSLYTLIKWFCSTRLDHRNRWLKMAYIMTHILPIPTCCLVSCSTGLILSLTSFLYPRNFASIPCR